MEEGVLAMHDELQDFAKASVHAFGNAVQRPHMYNMDDLDTIEGQVLAWRLTNQALFKWSMQSFLLLSSWDKPCCKLFFLKKMHVD